MALDLGFLRDPRRVTAIILIAVVGAAIATWLIVRGELVGADARAYWGGVRIWLSGGDLFAPPPPYLPFVYVPWSIVLFAPWAMLPWDTAWFAWQATNVLLLVWSVAWAYGRHPLATAALLCLVAAPLAATLDTGNITLLCALAVWVATFAGPRLGGGLWALATALKWFPLVLFPLLPSRARAWGLGFLALAVVLSLAVWPETVRQLELAVGFPRPIRLDYLLLLWAAIPWLWARPHLLEARTWPAQARIARADVGASLREWRARPDRLRVAWATARREARSLLGLESLS